MEKLNFIEDQEEMAGSLGVDPERKEMMVAATTKMVEKIINSGGNSIDIFLALREIVQTKEEAFLAGMLYTSTDMMLRNTIGTDDKEEDDEDSLDTEINDILRKLLN